MSLINDALKQARQPPPRNQPNSPPPLRPVVEESSSAVAWLIPVIVIILIVAAIFFIGWASAHRAVRSIVAAPEPGKMGARIHASIDGRVTVIEDAVVIEA